MINSYLILESASATVPTISKRNPNTVEFIAVLQEADQKNRNGRIYYKKVLEEALKAPYIVERLRTNSFYCEAGHPSDTSVQRQMTIDQRNIACLIKEFWWEGNLLKARVETADTVVGRDMKGLIEMGSVVAFSLRAQGNVHKDYALGATVVDAPIQIATYDWVVNPSHDKAFLETICEDTNRCFFNSRVNEDRMVALAESVELFENGALISMENTNVEKTAVDYARSYGRRIKPLSEAYIYDATDELTVDGRFAILENETVIKKVMLEDYLLKDIRNKIQGL